jgi:cytochrome c553
MPRISHFAFSIISICFLAGPVGTFAAGDPEAGKIKSYTCTGCHGIPGYKNVYPTYHVPKLGGQNEAYIVAALKGYRDGTRSHKTMVLQSQALSDQDIEDIAAYFASLEGGK